jgi:hypothetical protein
LDFALELTLSSFSLLRQSNGDFVKVGKPLLQEAADILSISKIPVQECLKYEFVITNHLDPAHFGSIKSHGVLIGLPAYFCVDSTAGLQQLTLQKSARFSKSTQQKLLDTLNLSRDAKRYAIARHCYLSTGYKWIFEKSSYLFAFVTFNGLLRLAFQSGLLVSMPAFVSLALPLAIASIYLSYLIEHQVSLYYSNDAVRLVCALKRMDLIDGGIEFCRQMLARNRLLARSLPNYELDDQGNRLDWTQLPQTDLQGELNQLMMAKTRLKAHQKRQGELHQSSNSDRISTAPLNEPETL